MGAIATSMLFQPPQRPWEKNANFIPIQTKTSKNRGHTINASLVLAEGAKYTVLFSHGNAEDLRQIYSWFKDVAIKLGVNILLYDYTGYGMTNKSRNPTEQDCFKDITCVFEYLTGVQGYKEEEIILYGRSLGSGASCELAMRQSRKGRPVAGVILQSPLMSAYRVAFHFAYSFPGDLMCNIDKIGEITCPIFIMHGRLDEIVPFYHGEQLYLAIKEKYRYQPLWIKGAGHNNIELTLKKRSGTHDTFFGYIEDFMNYITEFQKRRQNQL